MEPSLSPNTQLDSPALFPSTSLPPLADLSEYQRSPSFMRTVLVLPEISSAADLAEPSPRKKGAPVKPKNQLIRLLNFRNTRGKKFKFSFIPQILISHLHHLLGIKERTRTSCETWLRSYTAAGLGLQKLVREAAGPDTRILGFKRTVSMKDLREWLDGLTFTRDYHREELAQVRQRVFRLLCILKSIDIEEHYTADFNVETSSAVGGQVFRWYITQFLWEELKQPELTQTEIESTIASGVALLDE